jgi:hypothetical protein
MEPEKCSELSWFHLESLPSNIIPYVYTAIRRSHHGETYSEFGWEEGENRGGLALSRHAGDQTSLEYRSPHSPAPDR